MRRDLARRRLDEIDGAPEQTLAGYAALLRDLPRIALSDAEPTWKVQVTEAFVEMLTEAVLGKLSPCADEALRERLRVAVLCGPPAVVEFTRELAEAVQQAELPLEELERLTRRQACLELHLRCLEHLGTIFDSERAQP